MGGERETKHFFVKLRGDGVVVVPLHTRARTVAKRETCAGGFFAISICVPSFSFLFLPTLPSGPLAVHALLLLVAQNRRLFSVESRALAPILPRPEKRRKSRPFFGWFFRETCARVAAAVCRAPLSHYSRDKRLWSSYHARPSCGPDDNLPHPPW